MQLDGSLAHHSDPNHNKDLGYMSVILNGMFMGMRVKAETDIWEGSGRKTT